MGPVTLKKEALKVLKLDVDPRTDDDASPKSH